VDASTQKHDRATRKHQSPAGQGRQKAALNRPRKRATEKKGYL
jgi:hypothetical protein